MTTFPTPTRLTRTPLRVALLGLAALVSLAGCGGETLQGHPSASDAQRPLTPIGGTGSATQPQGLPANWSAQAVRAATAALTACSHTNSLHPQNCPQQVDQSETNLIAVHWTVLNQPLDHAVAVPDEQPGQGGPGQVAVYGQYQMYVSYTPAGQSLHPSREYTGGVAKATMTWDGRSFQNVAFVPGSARNLPAGVDVPPFSRPSDVAEAAVLQTVQSGFHECVTAAVTVSMPAPPNCPNGGPAALDPYFVNLHWMLNGDPMQGALVSFDTDHGNFAVTGSVSMTLTTTRRVSGQADQAQVYKSASNYTATLGWDGRQLVLVKIAAS